jgi:hypothetical protein
LVHRSTALAEHGIQLTPDLIPGGGPYSFRDDDVIPGMRYSYRLEALDRSGGSQFFGPVVAGIEAPAGQSADPVMTSLAPSEPNPFLPSHEYSTIHFTLARRSRAILKIFDAQGRCVRRLVDGSEEAGPHVVRWDGRNESGRVVGTGVYFYRLENEDFAESRRIVRLR